MARRKVQFADTKGDISNVVCTIPNREDLTPDDIANLWFSKEDYNTTRSAAKAASRDYARALKSRCLDDTFSGKRSKTVQERVEEWACNSDGMRGLERWSNRDHGETRQNEQFRVVMAVLEAQDEGLGAEHVRKTYSHSSKPARLFARMMGKADAVAVEMAKPQGVDDDDDALTIDTAATANTTKSGTYFSPSKKKSFLHAPNQSTDLHDSVHSSAFRIFRPFSPRKKKSPVKAPKQ